MKYGSMLSTLPVLFNFYNFDVDDDYNFLMGKVLLGLEQWICSSLLLSQGLCLMNVSVCWCK